MGNLIVRYSIWQSVWIQDIAVPLAVFLLFYFLRVPLTEGLFSLLRKAEEKAGKQPKGKLERDFGRPLRILLVGIGIFTALSICPAARSAAGLWPTAEKCFRSFLVIVPAWGLYRMADGIELENSLFAKKLDLQTDKALMPALSGIIRFVIVALAVLIIAQEWNYSISGLLAGLGLGGLAFALAAKDMLANLFGGLVLLLDRPFHIGDWIRTGDVEGSVEEITFRSVKIRTFGCEAVTVPNSMVASAPVTNFSRRGKRRVDFTLCLEYGTPVERVKTCSQKIQEMLSERNDVEESSIAVVLSGLGDSGMNLMVSCFAETADWMEYLGIREKIYYEVLEILEKEHAELAFPTQTVEIRKAGE